MCYMHFSRMRYHGSTDDPRRPWQEAFWSHVDFNGPVPEHDPSLGQCWVWTSSTDKRGYGIFGSTKAPYRAAHRTAWALVEGENPAGQVLHHCDNPPCLRRSHLYVGDEQANKDDMVRRGRSARGERNSRSVLTETDVLAIRASTEPQGQVAKQFGVSRVTISDIRRRKSWTYLP